MKAAHDKASQEDGGEQRQPRRAKREGHIDDDPAHHHRSSPEPAASGAPGTRGTEALGIGVSEHRLFVLIVALDVLYRD